MLSFARTPKNALALLCCASLATLATAFPFTVPITQSQSNLSFQLCIAGRCDTDSSPVSGATVIGLDSVDFPTQITLYDFDFQLTNDLSWLLSWAPLGQLTATGTGITVSCASPGEIEPAAVTNTQFTITNVPTSATGLLTYHATGLACTILQASGYLCNDGLDLANQGTQNGTMGGLVTTAARTVHLTSNIDQTTPLDPNNPTLGTLRVFGTVTGQAYVPMPIGDIDGDGDVDNLDFTYFAQAMAGPDVTTPPAGVTAYHFANSDLTHDNDVDLIDFLDFALRFGS
jgi:hypothetical protein